MRFSLYKEVAIVHVIVLSLLPADWRYFVENVSMTLDNEDVPVIILELLEN